MIERPCLIRWLESMVINYCEELNGSAFCAVKLETDEKMTIGYIARKASVMSEMGNKFLEELSKYKDKVLA